MTEPPPKRRCVRPESKTTLPKSIIEVVVSYAVAPLDKALARGLLLVRSGPFSSPRVAMAQACAGQLTASISHLTAAAKRHIFLCIMSSGFLGQLALLKPDMCPDVSFELALLLTVLEPNICPNPPFALPSAAPERCVACAHAITNEDLVHAAVWTDKPLFWRGCVKPEYNIAALAVASSRCRHDDFGEMLEQEGGPNPEATWSRLRWSIWHGHKIVGSWIAAAQTKTLVQRFAILDQRPEIRRMIRHVACRAGDWRIVADSGANCTSELVRSAIFSGDQITLQTVVPWYWTGSRAADCYTFMRDVLSCPTMLPQIRRLAARCNVDVKDQTQRAIEGGQLAALVDAIAIEKVESPDWVMNMLRVEANHVGRAMQLRMRQLVLREFGYYLDSDRLLQLLCHHSEHSTTVYMLMLMCRGPLSVRNLALRFARGDICFGAARVICNFLQIMGTETINVLFYFILELCEPENEAFAAEYVALNAAAQKRLVATADTLRDIQGHQLQNNDQTCWDRVMAAWESLKDLALWEPADNWDAKYRLKIEALTDTKKLREAAVKASPNDDLRLYHLQACAYGYDNAKPLDAIASAHALIVIPIAARVNNVELLRRLCRCDGVATVFTEALLLAVSQRHTETLEFFWDELEHCFCHARQEVLDAAVEHHHIDAIYLLHRPGLPMCNAYQDHPPAAALTLPQKNVPVAVQAALAIATPAYPYWTERFCAT